MWTKRGWFTCTMLAKPEMLKPSGGRLPSACHTFPWLEKKSFLLRSEGKRLPSHQFPFLLVSAWYVTGATNKLKPRCFIFLNLNIKLTPYRPGRYVSISWILFLILTPSLCSFGCCIHEILKSIVRGPVCYAQFLGNSVTWGWMLCVSKLRKD